MNMIRKSFSILFFVIFMFCAIFTPDFFPFSMRYLIVMISVVGAIWGCISSGTTLIDENCLPVIKGFIPFIAYFVFSSLLRCILYSTDINIYLSALIHTLMAFFGALFICIFIVQICKRNAMSFDGFVYVLLAVMVIQFVCVVLALAIPSVRLYFNMLIVNNSYSEGLADLARASIRGWADRSYGLANNLFDSFGYITSMLIVLFFVVGMEKRNNALIFLSIIFILMPLVNARTGLVLVLIGFFISSLFYKDVKSVLKLFGTAFFAIVMLVFLLDYLPDTMVKWLSSGFQETLALFSGSGETGGVYSEIFGSDLQFPSNILFGEGAAPSTFNYNGIDNGYINCFWYFGLIGTVMLFGGYINLFRTLYGLSDSKSSKVISVVFIAIFFAYMLKLYPVDNFGGNVVLFGIPFLMISLQKKQYSDNLLAKGNI